MFKGTLMDYIRKQSNSVLVPHQEESERQDNKIGPQN